MTDSFKKIAIALDLSEGDEFVLQYLSFWLSSLEVSPELHVFHNIKYDIDEDILDELDEPLEQIIEDELRQKVNAYLPRLGASTKITIGQDSSTIGALVEFVKHEKCDLTVFGKKLDIEGSGITTSRFLRQNQSAVLTVPTKPRKSFTNICVPIDFSKNSASALKVGLELAARGDAHLTPMHVYHVPQVYFPYIPVKPVTKGKSNRAQEQFQEFLEEYFFQYMHLSCNFVDGHDQTIVKAIITYTRAHKIDLVILGLKGESSFIGSVAIGLSSSELRVPLLFVK